MSRTYGSLSYVDGSWVMSDVPPHVAIRVKHLFPRVPKTATAPFTFPANQSHCADLDWFRSRYPLEMTDEDRARLVGGRLKFESDQAELGRILSPDYTPAPGIGLRPGRTIRHYQSQNKDIVLVRKSLLVGDEVGLGKTITAVAMFLDPRALPAAVVVQTHLQRQWAEKIAEFTNLRVHKIKKGSPYSLPPADVYIFRYGQIAGWVDFYKTGFFHSVTYDEPQELRTGAASNKGVAAMTLSDQIEQDDGYRLGLSATPIYGYGAEAWNIMRVIDRSVLGDREDFMREWSDGSLIVKDPDALGSFLREQGVFVKRTKKDVGMELPKVDTIVETIPSDDGAIAKIAEIARMLALRTITGTFTERGQAARELDMMARQATGVGKAPYVAAYVRMLLENNVPVMLAGWHREFWNIITTELKEFNPLMYTGTESPAQKDKSKKAFMAGDSNLLCISLRSGAGLDGCQHRCSTVVIGELDWSAVLMNTQLIGRVDRDGQKSPVTAIYLVSEDGSDPPMMDLLGLKGSQAAGITDPGKVFEQRNPDKSRVRALAEAFLSRKELADAQAVSGPAADIPDTDIPAEEDIPSQECAPAVVAAASVEPAPASSNTPQPELF
jgi:hypothetical protein